MQRGAGSLRWGWRLGRFVEPCSIVRSPYAVLASLAPFGLSVRCTVNAESSGEVTCLPWVPAPRGDENAESRGWCCCCAAPCGAQAAQRALAQATGTAGQPNQGKGLPYR